MDPIKDLLKKSGMSNILISIIFGLFGIIIASKLPVIIIPAFLLSSPGLPVPIYFQVIIGFNILTSGILYTNLRITSSDLSVLYSVL